MSNTAGLLVMRGGELNSVARGASGWNPHDFGAQSDEVYVTS